MHARTHTHIKWYIFSSKMSPKNGEGKISHWHSTIFYVKLYFMYRPSFMHKHMHEREEKLHRILLRDEKERDGEKKSVRKSFVYRSPARSVWIPNRKTVNNIKKSDIVCVYVWVCTLSMGKNGCSILELVLYAYMCICVDCGTYQIEYICFNVMCARSLCVAMTVCVCVCYFRFLYAK